MEEILAGGNMEQVVRVGDTVRRVAGAWTPAVHALLDVLADAGIEEAPRALGTDAQGREVLSFLPGSVLAEAPATVLWSDQVLVDAARLLRRVHDASVELVGRADLAWRSSRREPAEVICHNDFAAYNLIERNGRVAGVIDFDFASPGSRIWDLAYLAYRLVPFAEDAQDAPNGESGRRLAMLTDAYGTDPAPERLVSVMALRLDDLAAFTRGRAQETGRADLSAHAAMYARDAARLRQRGREQRHSR